MRVFFYTKEGCPLCRTAEEMLEEIAGEYGLTVNRIDISDDREARRRYAEMIPVIELPGGGVLWGRIDRDEIREALLRAHSGGKGEVEGR